MRPMSFFNSGGELGFVVGVTTEDDTRAEELIAAEVAMETVLFNEAPVEWKE